MHNGNRYIAIAMCVSIFVIPSLQCSLYTCCSLCKSQGSKPPGDGEALMWAVNVMAIQSRDKKPSLSVS